MAEYSISENAVELESKVKNIIVKYFTIKDIFIYIVIFSAVTFLGLMNWADFTFDWERLSFSYLAHSFTQTLAYGAIIASLSTKQLDKRKERDEEYLTLRKFNFKILEFYRPDKLKEYVDKTNLEMKRQAYLDKYRNLLNNLEIEFSKKDNSFTYDKTWKAYIKDKQESEAPDEIKPPNEYCSRKEYFLNKIQNVDDEYEDDSVEYDRLSIDDLISGIKQSEKRRIPRMSETVYALKGVGQQLIMMLSGSLVIAGFFLNPTDGGIDAWVKTLFTVFLVALSVLKGMMNGDKVFFNLTLVKEAFRKHHLHSYSVYEAKQYKHIVGGELEKHS